MKNTLYRAGDIFSRSIGLMLFFIYSGRPLRGSDG
jgi:hypothetical protein